MTKETVLLAGDIGGTKTSLAIFSTEAGLHAPLVEKTFPSGNYDSLEAVVEEFLAQVRPRLGSLRLEEATFGVAGPVVGGRAKITNLPWELSETQLAERLNLPVVYLLNDLVSIGQAVPHLEAGDLHTLKEGEAVPQGAIAVVAPGTGLGETYLTWDETRYLAHPSEGGHVDFAPTNELELEMLRYLRGRFKHISYERVCSGKGLPNIYDFLKASGHAEEPAWLAERLAGVKDPVPVIVQAALDEERACRLCRATLETFVSILGAEAGNMALKVLASGGVYLGGGIPPRILPLLESDLFLEAFGRKGRFADFLSRVPVYVILNPKAALLGAAHYGFDRQALA